jgi:hypothetical protein
MFNALRYREELEEAGFSREQAEVSVKVLIDVMNDNFATKSDLKELDLKLESSIQSLSAKIDSVEKRLEAKIDARADSLEQKFDLKFESTNQKIESTCIELEYKLIVKLGVMMGGMLTLSLGAIVTLAKLLQSGH